MAKSGKKANRSPNQLQSQNIVTSPEISPVDSSRPLPPPIEAAAPNNAPTMAIPRPVDGLTNADRKLARFLARHKIGKRAFENTPKIEPILNRAIGGRQRAIETLKFSKDPSAIQLLAFCAPLDWNTRQDVPFEALCLAAEVDPTKILGAVILAARDVSRAEAALITVREHPEVVEATANFAKLPDYEKDREMFHKAAGWLPTPKGSNINVNIFDPKPSVDSEDPDDDGPITLEGIFGSDPREIETLGERRRILLESGKPEK